METSGYGIALHEVLEEYSNCVDIQSLTKDQDEQKKLESLAKALTAQLERKRNAEPSSVGETKGEKTLSIAHKVTSDIKFPKYKGAFREANNFVKEFKACLSNLHYDKSEYFSLL